MTTGIAIAIGIIQGAILGAVLFIAKKLIEDIPDQIRCMKGGLIQRPPNLTALEYRVNDLVEELTRHYLKQSLDIDYKIGELIKVEGEIFKITYIAKDEANDRAKEISIEGVGVKVRT